ncbi:MAG: formylglycine-generating enzyme family protein [Planctomycetota bacterium]
MARTLILIVSLALWQERPAYPDMPPGRPPAVAVAGAVASTEAQMQPYREIIVGSSVTFQMTPIPGGTFTMGSPDGEPGRGGGEGPQHDVSIEPFWMGVHEVTWDEYQIYQLKLDQQVHTAAPQQEPQQDAFADAVSRPTPPYVPMDFGMGIHGYPAIAMSQFAARHYTKWLSMKTGRFYRLPSEAEWEYACRAGSHGAYSFGERAEDLGEYAWFQGNAGEHYHKVGEKKPNAWGLFDMHGNVAEWVLDAYSDGFYATLAGQVAKAPVNWPTELYGQYVRGGSDDRAAAAALGGAARASKKGWNVQDPQLPKSIWYLTDARFVGLRVVRPLHDPSDAEQKRFWDPDLEQIDQVLQRQRKGGR